MVGKRVLHALGIALAFSVGLANAQQNAAPAARENAPPLASVLAADAPARYTIKAGDTLWSLASVYLKTPWRWPDLWRMNRNDIKNPHLIYPGQVLALTFDANGQPVLALEGGGTRSDAGVTNVSYDGPRPTVKLSPRLRYDTIARDVAVPSIPPAELEPFLSRPLVIDAETLNNNPQIVLTDDKRVILANGDVAYALGVDEKKGREWQVYRSAGELRDPRWAPKPWWDRGEDWVKGRTQPDLGILGYEAKYLGDARVLQFGDVTKVEILNAKEEIVPQDRLIVAPVPEKISYVPRAPEKTIDSVVIKLDGPIAEAGKGSVVTLAVGARDGLEIGHVVSFFRPPRQVDNPRYKLPGVFSMAGFGFPDPNAAPQYLTLPAERIGLGFVFRTFDRVAYVYVVSSSAMVRVGDFVRNP
jgi:LysM repeat protein